MPVNNSNLHNTIVTAFIYGQNKSSYGFKTMNGMYFVLSKFDDKVFLFIVSFMKF